MKHAAATTRPRVRASQIDEGFEAPQVASLSNGRYCVQLSAGGGGYSQCGGIAISRCLTDETRQADGFHLYLRDLDDNFVWSAGYQPVRVLPSKYSFHASDRVAEIVRLDRDIECRLTVCVSPTWNLEIRRCELTNHGDGPRRIELTSYLEWVLASREADASHPAFSKLFVETQFLPERRAVLARRRPRHADDSECWGFHALVADIGSEARCALQFETNRTKFIGRGRSLARPQALEAGVELCGDFGPVLDPIASLRVPLELAPGEARHAAFILGFAACRSEIDDVFAAIGDSGEVERVLRETQSISTLGGNGALMSDGSSSPMAKAVIVHPPHRAAANALPSARRRLPFMPAATSSSDGAPPKIEQESLLFENGYGGFSADGREYVLRLKPDGRGGQLRPPLPWVNVIANEQAGFLVTESGAGYTWAGNSRENRLTAWHNDPLVDPHGEAFWIRDEDGGVFWSPTPGPTPAPAEYVVRHGFGYTTFHHESHELSQELTMFVPRDEPVKIARLRIVNRSRRERRLSLLSFSHWALGGAVGDRHAIGTEYDAERQVIWASNPQREHYGGCSAFSALAVADTANVKNRVVSFSCDRTAFVGRYGDMDAPAAIAAGGELDRRTGSGLDPCAAWQAGIELQPGGTYECTYLLGETGDRDAAAGIIEKYRDAANVQRAFEEAVEFWRHSLSAIAVETPDRELDLMINGWLAYQNLSCRMWARSAYYQPGGAFGFRDQLQDAAALIYHQPELTRIQILRNAAQQFAEGDVLHWWHPDSGYGLRTRFSDDLLWLPYLAAEYVAKTGDRAILDEELPFITAPPLAEGQQEAFLRPTHSGEIGTLYEHCCRALDRGLTAGQNGLPLIGCGDWNDGFSRIGRMSRGESVWLGFFIDHLLSAMLPICSERGDGERVARYMSYRERLRAALDTAGWDGAWYRRAYYDDGQPIGSAGSDECQIDALAQAWAVISGAAPPDRAQAAMQAVEDRLIDDEAGMIRLLTPPFDRTPNDPGYIKGYLPGIRENGGQYTHGVLWVVRAMAEMGRGTRAVELLKMLSPVSHTSTAEQVAIYQTEPYVVAADVYGEPPHVGRGGWTWYTGSAGWMLRVAIESIFGFSMEGGRTLVIDPSISSDWPQCRLTYRMPDGRTRYEITIENPAGHEHGVREATVDGEPAAIENGAARVPIERDGQTHRVTVRL